MLSNESLRISWIIRDITRLGNIKHVFHTPDRQGPPKEMWTLKWRKGWGQLRSTSSYTNSTLRSMASTYTSFSTSTRGSWRSTSKLRHLVLKEIVLIM